MDQLEIDYLLRNKSKLIDLTYCTTSFLSIFVSRQVITQEEQEKIEAISTDSARADKFYSIIYRRKHAYGCLRDSLSQTCQSGALEIIDRFSVRDACTTIKSLGTIEYAPNIVIGRASVRSIVHNGSFRNQEVTVKKVYTDSVYFTALTDEIKIIRRTPHHQNIIEYLHHEEGPKYWLIAYERCDFSLQSIVASGECCDYEIDILKQITTGLHFLHENSIVHGDLKPTNILLKHVSNHRICAKVADFRGRLAYQSKGNIAPEANFHSQCWRAPEVLSYLAGDLEFLNLTKYSDMFVLGCVFHYVLTLGLHPFGDMVRAPANILEGKPNLKGNKLLIHGFRSIIKRMLKQNPEKRTTCEKVLARKIFRSQITGNLISRCIC